MTMTTPPNRSAALQISAFILAWLLLEYVLVRRLALAWVPLFAGGFVVWWFTTRKTPIDVSVIVVPYLLTTILFMAHVCEEYATYARGLPSITPLRATLLQMIMFAATLGPIAWVLGAIMMFKRWPVGFFVASTFLFGMMFIEPSHLIVPFWGGRFHYVGGMWTAVPLSACAWYTFFAIRREILRIQS